MGQMTEIMKCLSEKTASTPMSTISTQRDMVYVQLPCLLAQRILMSAFHDRDPLVRSDSLLDHAACDSLF